MANSERTTSESQEDELDSNRRVTLGFLLSGLFALAVNYFPVRANSSQNTEADKDMALVELIRLLRGMNKKVCDAAATSMEASLARGSSIKLHLRDAGLELADASELAKALVILTNSPDSTQITSFSVSYNRKLGNPGTVALAKSLPPTVNEIGFVDCNFGDEGALALLEWAQQSSDLKMICIEQNKLSADMRSRYELYRQTNPRATVIF